MWVNIYQSFPSVPKLKLGILEVEKSKSSSKVKANLVSNETANAPASLDFIPKPTGMEMEVFLSKLYTCGATSDSA